MHQQEPGVDPHRSLGGQTHGRRPDAVASLTREVPMTPIASIAGPCTGARPHDRRAMFRRPERRIAGLVRIAGLLALLTPVLAQAQDLANERRAALRQAIG